MKGLARSPIPRFEHLHRMTNDIGLFEHALLDMPRREGGYCVDDVARALVVVLRQPLPSLGVTRLADTYLDFTLRAVEPDGTVHNRMSVEGDWEDESGVGDWWGRAIWALGAAAIRAPRHDMRRRALDGFHLTAQQRPPDLMSLVFAALGAVEVLTEYPDDAGARGLLWDLISFIGPIDLESDWPWPEVRMRYSNGHVVEALLVAGSSLDQQDVRKQALGLLAFLLAEETNGDHLSPTPVGGRGPGDAKPAFDQQSIEVAALADACARAYSLTHDDRWLTGVERSWAWFAGNNDVGAAMFDQATGAGYDGLESDGPNMNQGAESTIAVISTAQHARELGLLK